MKKFVFLATSFVLSAAAAHAESRGTNIQCVNGRGEPIITVSHRADGTASGRFDSYSVQKLSVQSAKILGESGEGSTYSFALKTEVKGVGEDVEYTPYVVAGSLFVNWSKPENSSYTLSVKRRSCPLISLAGCNLFLGQEGVAGGPVTCSFKAL